MMWKKYLTISMAALLIGITCKAQHNLIDVPSSELVENRKLFFQEQAVFTSDEINTSTIFTYGLKNSFEIGLTLYKFNFKRAQGLDVTEDKPEENPDFLINVQKGFDINEWLTIGAGTRAGINVAKKNADLRLVHFDYLNSRFSIQKHHLIGGVYYANTAYAGEGTHWGVMAGIDIELVKEKLRLLADVFSGHSTLSVINTGLEFSLPNEWKITAGAQFPTPGSENNNGAVLQISKN